MTTETHEDRIRHLCYLITAVFLSEKLTEKEKYKMIETYAASIGNEAEDKLVRCQL